MSMRHAGSVMSHRFRARLSIPAPSLAVRVGRSLFPDPPRVRGLLALSAWQHASMNALHDLIENSLGLLFGFCRSQFGCERPDDSFHPCEAISARRNSALLRC